MNMNYFIITFIFMLHPLLLAQKTIPLFENGHPVENYNDLLNDIQNENETLVKKGDFLKFSNGKTVRFNGYVDKGGKTIIIETDNNRAIRLSKNTKSFSFQVSYVFGYEAQLRESSIPIAKVFDYDADNPREYVEVEKLNIKFNLGEFTRNNWFEDEKHSTETNDFYKFVESTWDQSQIGDFRFEQIVYTDKGWVLLDWINTGNKYGRWNQLHVFSSLKFPKPVEKKISDIIHSQRSQNPLPKRPAGYISTMCKFLRNFIAN